MDDSAHRTVSAASAAGGIVPLVPAQVHSGLVEALALGTVVLRIGAIAQAVLIRRGLDNSGDGAGNERHHPRSPR